jgi:hypothetical protein
MDNPLERIRARKDELLSLDEQKKQRETELVAPLAGFFQELHDKGIILRGKPPYAASLIISAPIPGRFLTYECGGYLSTGEYRGFKIDIYPESPELYSFGYAYTESISRHANATEILEKVITELALICENL